MRPQRWLLLVHQLPARPPYVRVKVWRKLQALGAVPVKNSIYVLPDRPETREDFEWLRKGILAMKGEASVFLSGTVSDADDADIIAAFRRARAKDLERFIEVAAAVRDRLKGILDGGHVRPETLGRVEKDRAGVLAEWDRLRKIDFFHSPGRAKAEALVSAVQGLLRKAEARARARAPEPPPAVDAKSLRGRVWVTRVSPHVDRLASAWLVTRFIDPGARFKFVEEPYRAKAGRELRFDMAEAEFTHFGDWCTFETILHRLRLEDAALGELAQVVHDLDLKDGKFGRAEAPGVDRMLEGLCLIYEDDDARVAAAAGLFDTLYAAYVKDKGRANGDGRGRSR